MKCGVITDGISRDFEHALNVMAEFELEYAELQYFCLLYTSDAADE